MSTNNCISCSTSCNIVCVATCLGNCTGTNNAETEQRISGACTTEACYGPVSSEEHEDEFVNVNGTKVRKKKKNKKDMSF